MKKTFANFFIAITILCIVPTFANADDSPIFNAMHDEIQRSMDELIIDGLKKPYYIEYKLTISADNSAQASLGQLIRTRDNVRSAVLDVSVRVGDYKFDQKNFFDIGLNFFGSSDEEESYQNRSVPIELDYETLRRELWLATDAAYKEAAELLSRKEAALKNQIRKDTLWDYSLADPQTLIDTVSNTLFDANKMTEMATAISAVFNDYPTINQSRVTCYYNPVTIYYMNSEGTRYAKNSTTSGIEVGAFTQASDGMPLYDYYVALGEFPSDLPKQDSVIKAVKAVADNLDALLKANVLEDSYSGPIMLSSQASAEIFAQNFLPLLIAQRGAVQADGMRLSLGATNFAAFQKKIGGRVLPEFMSITDNPLLSEFEHRKLLGDYKIDDQGILPQEVKLVENGYLKTLLSDRVPIQRITQSNGHSRNGLPMFSNVKIDVSKKEQLTDAKMKEALIKHCKQRDLPYGIYIKKLADNNMLRTQIYDISKGATEYPRVGASTIQPIEAYKIYQDGKEELIRGGLLAGVSAASFKDIINAGTRQSALNLLMTPPASLNAMFAGDVLVSIICPSILFEDGEFQAVETNFRKPPYLANPLGLK